MRTVKRAMAAVVIAGLVTVSLYFVHEGTRVKNTSLIPVTIVSEITE